MLLTICTNGMYDVAVLCAGFLVVLGSSCYSGGSSIRAGPRVTFAMETIYATGNLSGAERTICPGTNRTTGPDIPLPPVPDREQIRLLQDLRSQACSHRSRRPVSITQQVTTILAESSAGSLSGAQHPAPFWIPAFRRISGAVGQFTPALATMGVTAVLQTCTEQPDERANEQGTNE